MIVVDLSHANDTGIGQRHRCVTIISQQPVERADMLVQSKRHRQRAILQKAKTKRPGPLGSARAETAPQ